MDRILAWYRVGSSASKPLLDLGLHLAEHRGVTNPGVVVTN